MPKKVRQLSLQEVDNAIEKSRKMEQQARVLTAELRHEIERLRRNRAQSRRVSFALNPHLKKSA